MSRVFFRDIITRKSMAPRDIAREKAKIHIVFSWGICQYVCTRRSVLNYEGNSSTHSFPAKPRLGHSRPVSLSLSLSLSAPAHTSLAAFHIIIRTLRFFSIRLEPPSFGHGTCVAARAAFWRRRGFCKQVLFKDVWRCIHSNRKVKQWSRNQELIKRMVASFCSYWEHQKLSIKGFKNTQLQLMIR